MKTFRFILFIAATMIIAGCSKSQNFNIKGEVDGLGAKNVVITYFTDGGIKRNSSPATDGKFAFEGTSMQPTLATVTLADGSPLATLVVKNGDKIRIKASMSDPAAIEVKGNSSSEKIAQWTRENAEIISSGNAEAINRSIAGFVSRNTSDIASTALIVSVFRTDGYEHLADSLFTMIDASARPLQVVQNFSSVLASQLATTAHADIAPITLYNRADSITTFNPRRHSISLLAFVPESRTTRDSVIPAIRQLHNEYPSYRLGTVEISTAPDSASWKQSIAADSASWTQAWAPGSVAATHIKKLAVPRIPFFIVTDSVGAQLYRGPSISAARDTITARLK